MTRDEILSLGCVPERVPLSNGNAVHVRAMTLVERDSFEQAVYGKDADAWMQVIAGELLARCICDEGGVRVFTDADATKVGALSATVLDPAYTAAKRLNRMRAVDMETAAGN